MALTEDGGEPWVAPADGCLRWIRETPTTKPGGNSAQTRERREARSELEAVAWRVRRNGVTHPLTGTDVNECEGVVVDEHGEAWICTDVHGEEVSQETAIMNDVILLTVAEAAAALTCTPRWVRELIRRGELGCVRIGRRAIRVRQEDIDAFLGRAAGGE